MRRALGFPVGVLAAVAGALAISNTSAFAYASGTIGYDISYPQCGTSASGAPALRSSASAVRFAAGRAGALLSASALAEAASQPRATAPQAGTTPFRTRSATFGFGIIGVDSGYPFMSAAHPGNPCLASEYANAPSPGLYINTGFDPIYTDMNHTTTSCASQSLAIQGDANQRKAWAAGCSEAQGDYGYAQGKGITTPLAWWLDVETGNSWCGQSGTNCTDLSWNQYTIQGIIDTFTHIGAVPIGIYSTKSQWQAVVGSLTVSGASADWYAIGPGTAQQAAAHCSNTYSFSGAPVTIVQYVYKSTDLDYAC